MSTALREQQIYSRVEQIERDLREIKLLLMLNRADHHTGKPPAQIGGLWAGTVVSDAEISEAEHAVFPHASKGSAL
jgi:hypothetical protein